MIIRVIEKEKWTNKKRPCQKKTRALYFWHATNRTILETGIMPDKIKLIT